MWEFLKSPSRRRREAQERLAEQVRRDKEALKEQERLCEAAAKAAAAAPVTPTYKPYYPRRLPRHRVCHGDRGTRVGARLGVDM